MSDPPTTRPSLLVRLRDARDTGAWSEFVRLYAPLVYRYGRRHGLQDADAADLTQEVLRAVISKSHKLEDIPRQGSFRGWLFTVAHHKLYDLRARQKRQEQRRGENCTLRLESQLVAGDEELWNQAYQRRVFAWAAEQVRGDFSLTTWQAFWQSAVEGNSGKEVARRLKVSVAAVYIAKSRVMARLKEVIHGLVSGEW